MSILDKFKFSIHPNIPSALLGIYETKDYDYRIAAGPGFFSTPGGIKDKQAVTDPNEVTEFEFIVRSKSSLKILVQEGWQTTDDIAKVIDEYKDRKVI